MEKKITVYSATGWASCHAAKEFLSHQNIPFTDRNVAEDPDALRELTEKTGRRATPVIVIDGEIIVGFDRGKLERLLGLWEKMTDEVLCPGCGEKVSLRDLKVGDRIDCSNCANLTLGVKERDGKYFLAEISKASCPSCERVLEVPDGLVAGDILRCCDQDYVLTYEFEAYALKSIGR